MAFLRNRTINLVNLHYGIQALAMGMGGVFFLVILLRAGLSASVVLCTMALILIGRFALRPLVLVFAKRWGLKPALVFGTVVLSAQYPMLAAVHGIGAQLVVLILIASLGDTFYWSTYHAYFASLGDSEHRGHQVSAREALAAVVGIVAPLIGAWAIVTVGPGIAFACVGFIQALAAICLCWERRMSPFCARRPAPSARRFPASFCLSPTAGLRRLLFLSGRWRCFFRCAKVFRPMAARWRWPHWSAPRAAFCSAAISMPDMGGGPQQSPTSSQR
jgi:hypothetical protein